MQLALFAQRIGHGGLRPVGDHLDGVDEALALGAQTLETALFRQLGREVTCNEKRSVSFLVNGTVKKMFNEIDSFPVDSRNTVSLLRRSPRHSP